jgi:hypothetical protein
MKRKVRRKMNDASISKLTKTFYLGRPKILTHIICFKFMKNFGQNQAESATTCISCARNLSRHTALVGHFNSVYHLKNKVMLDLANEIRVAVPNLHMIRSILECNHIEPTSIYYLEARFSLDAHGRVVLNTGESQRTVPHTDFNEEFRFLRFASTEFNAGNGDFAESKMFLDNYVAFLSVEVRNDLNAYNKVSYALHFVCSPRRHKKIVLCHFSGSHHLTHVSVAASSRRISCIISKSKDKRQEQGLRDRLRHCTHLLASLS